MKRNLIVAFVVLACASLVVPALAKRSPPKSVLPLSEGGIEYSAPLDREGFLVATWEKTKREIWSRQVYVIKHEYKYGLEADVQNCFITKLELQGEKIHVWNERGAEFVVDLKSLEVTVVKGQPVIDFTDRTRSDK